MKWFLITQAFCLALVSPIRAADKPPPLYPSLGEQSFPITTRSEDAQQLFNQGMLWTYGFHHEAAIRSFRAALERDPECALCYWGIAYALGPNINRPMPAEAVKPALEALEKAQARMEGVTPREQALIRALAKRYAADPPADRSALDKAYAEAMEEVFNRFPDDADVASLYAEALMDTTPWHYWNKDGTPLAVTPKILAALERALKVAPRHAGANHYLIHAVESHHPQKGIQAADTLRDLNLGAGHLVHMPSHIYIRVGRYHDATVANQNAVREDLRYLEAYPEPGFYAMMYVPHNYEFLVAAASLEGRSALALQSATELARYVSPHLSHADPAMAADVQNFASSPLMVRVRFGRWSEVLKTAEPAAEQTYARALWHFARSLAFIRAKRIEEAEAEIAKLAELTELPAHETMKLMGLNSVRSVLSVGLAEARGELAAARVDREEAIRHLENAVALQDALTYIEPPPWFHSVRLTLGAVLLDGGEAARAEAVYREDLTRFPENGWALVGLREALQEQRMRGEAAEAEGRFVEAWRHADVRITGSRL